MYKLKLDSRKAIEAVAILAGQSPDRKISRKRLLALLYIASRECLKKSGRPLLGGRLVAMKYGPIHGDVYDLVNKGEGIDGTDWARHFHNDGYYVVFDTDPGVNALSRFEVRVLTETLKKHEQKDDWDTALQTHGFREYHITYRKGRARTITLEQIIQAVGLSPMSGTIMRDLKEKEEIDEMFASVNEAPRKKRRLLNK